ncbi:K(+)/H(+) antiporter NhaP [Novipirellula galeiformis]|uniref:K(+)/H(+) antiporter NhaP n=1 Tax=Novipirellula galeiformis TaxID=2528004 RepID=A0A5C6CRU7_9BACT|nr:sodium:proton antiporter [Novipirellula galeiformis]TWU27108.1 K(+)/H(+) antiporter NhaP [Novipirellula galeiformis]
MDLLLYLALIPSLGVAAQWIAWRTGLPGILLLLLFGVLLGQFVQPDSYLAELTGGEIAKAGPELLFPIVSLSVAVIMFEGGLSLKFHELREAGSAAFRLVTLGALITFLGTAVASHFTLGFAWPISFLLGAILTVTGPTVIGPLLRQVRPTRRVASTLKWEGIVIDPIGAVLAVLVFENILVHSSEPNLGSAIFMLSKTILVGMGLGCAGGAFLTTAFRRYWVPDQLHGIGTLSVGLLLYAISDHLAHESGLITVTVIGLWLTNQRHFDIEHIIELKENLRTLLIGCLFIVLGSRVAIDDVIAHGWHGLLFLLLMILIVRPISAFVSLLGSPLDLRERAFVASLAPRGIVAAAVSSVFALEIERRGGAFDLAGSDQLATVTFLVIAGTVAVYGIAASPIARLLGLADEKSNGALIAGAEHWVRDFALELNNAGVPVMLLDTNYNKVSQARVAGLRAECINILNEHARKDLTVAGIGRFLAMTPNDEVNSLAVRECRGMFERAQLYQLNFSVKNTNSRREMTRNLMGRQLFREGLTFSKIRDLHESGALFKTTKLSDSFSYTDFIRRYNEVPELLCVISSDGTPLMNTVSDPLKPESGQTIICLVTSVPLPVEHVAMDPETKSAKG